jgi:hypothetical protein
MADVYEEKEAKKRSRKRKLEDIPDESYHITKVWVGYCRCPGTGKCRKGCIKQYDYDGRRYFTADPAPEAANQVRKWVGDPKNSGFRSRFGLGSSETLGIRLEKRQRNAKGEVVKKMLGGTFRFRYDINKS